MADDALNKLCKWRMILAGWHNGSKSIGEPGVKAMRDLMDKWLVVRAEASALAALLIQKKVFSHQEFHDQVMHEATLLDAQMAEFFPGFRTIQDGVEIYDVSLAAETTKRLGFPP
jgi:hypothetical protein